MNGQCQADDFFEGVEKLLEIWFEKSKDSKEKNSNGDARLVPQEMWENVLDIVQCKVMCSMEYGNQIAFLLSESSMFISKRRVILKTCGSTLCLQAFPHIVKLVKNFCGLDVVADIFYSRKNFMKPDRQPHVHTSFQNEIRFLDKHLNGQSAAYCLGKLNGDCWYLYTSNHPANCQHIGVKEPDQTLELLMVDLDPKAMKKYTFLDENGKVRSADEFTEEIGIKSLMPNSKIHSKLFEPCGYSMNGLMENEVYWTIHVTPEPEYSFVSFETNLPTENYRELIGKIVSLFKPGRFTMTLFIGKYSVINMKTWTDKLSNEPVINGYTCADMQTARLQEYDLSFTNYLKEDDSL